MSESNLKNELLKQNGKSAVDEEVSRLRTIIAAEQWRVRRLAFWTVGVWTLWFLLITLSLGIPMVSRAMSESTPPSTAPSVMAPPHRQSFAGAAGILKAVIAMACFACALGLPVAGIVLAIMLIIGRRTASVNQVRASLAAIDAQLRMLGAPGVKVD